MHTTMLVIAIGSTFVFGALVATPLLISLTSAFNRTRSKERTFGKLGNAAGDHKLMRAALRNGVVVLRPLSAVFCRIRPLRASLEKYARALACKGYRSDVQNLFELLVAAQVVLIILIYVLFGTLVVSILCAAALLFLIEQKANKVLNQRQARLIEQIPDALRSLGICFASGFTIQQAFDQLSHETAEPLGSELTQTANDINAGKSVTEALSDLESRTKAEDLSFALIALEIQHKTGGSLQDLLENAADSIVASADLRRQLNVQTTQARMSAKVVTILPLALVAMLSLSMEGYLESFFTSSAGMTILIVAVVLELAGILLIRKILGVNLD